MSRKDIFLYQSGLVGYAIIVLLCFCVCTCVCAFCVFACAFQIRVSWCVCHHHRLQCLPQRLPPQQQWQRQELPSSTGKPRWPCSKSKNPKAQFKMAAMVNTVEPPLLNRPLNVATMPLYFVPNSIQMHVGGDVPLKSPLQSGAPSIHPSTHLSTHLSTYLPILLWLHTL